jgi:hypothetical protein
MHTAMPPAPTFLATLALLSYRLLFHSERELNISSLLFCTACAWSVAQLAHMYVTNEATDEYSDVAWALLLRVLETLRAAAAHGLNSICLLSLYGRGSESYRDECSKWVDWLEQCRAAFLPAMQNTAQDQQ